MSFEQLLQHRLHERLEANLYRERVTITSNEGPLQIVGGAKLVNFCSNDYLGLASSTRVAQAVCNSVVECGFGSGASHLVSGHSNAHHKLELALARKTGRSRALLFSTGYMANLGLVTALAGRDQHLIGDKLNHASLVDACQLASAKNSCKQFFRYRHCDVAHLEQLLKKAPPYSLVLTDGVFSMDGDIAPLKQLAELCQRYNAVLAVDDAHGFGVLGEGGAGTVVAEGLGEKEVPIYMGTLGKAIGGFGAFVAGSDVLIESLIQFARPYIYTTALPPAVAEGNLAGLLCLEEDQSLLSKLNSNIEFFKHKVARVLRGSSGCTLLPSNTAIQPVILATEEKVIRVATVLKEAGFWVGAIRPPTVPNGTARLRITLSAAHSHDQITELVEVLGFALHEADLPV